MKTILIVVVGIALAAGGAFLSTQVHLGFQEEIVKMGIPLDLGKTIAMIGMFLLLFPVLQMFYFKPLGEAIQNRTTELENTFKEAEDLRTEMAQLRADYDRRLAETEAQAREQIQAQIKEAQALRDSLRAEAVQQAEELKRRAIDEIESEKQHILTDLRLHVVNLTLSATEKLVGQAVDSETNRRLVEEFIDKVEVPG